MSKIFILLRVSIACAFLGLAGWYGYDHVIGLVSDGGILTAPVVTIRSPINGTIRGFSKQSGDIAAAGEKIAEINDSFVDIRSFAETSARLVSSRNAAHRIVQTLHALEAEAAALQLQVDTYQRAAESRLTATVIELDAEIERAKAILDLENSRFARIERLARQGNAANAELEQIQSAKRQAEADIMRLQALREGHLIELNAARAGTYLNQGYFETPYSRQHLDQVKMRILELVSERAAIENQIADLEQSLTAEAARNETLRQQQVTVPSRSLISNVHVAEGGEVIRGQPIVDIVICDDPTLEVDISEAKYSQIAVGDIARVQLTGISADVIGRIRSIRTAAAVTEMQNRAASINVLGDRMMTVTIDIHRDDLASVGIDACYIGRRAKVFFQNQRVSATIDDIADSLQSWTKTVLHAF